MKKLVLFFAIMMGFLLNNVNVFSQFVYVSYNINNKKHRFPILKFEGEKCYWNNEESDLKWRNTPFRISDKFDYANLDYEDLLERASQRKIVNVGMKFEQFVDSVYSNERGNARLYDAAGEMIGWFNGNDFYMQSGWVVLDNKKKYYSHKEFIYNEKLITGRSCSGQKFWITQQKDSKTYLQEAENRIDGTKTKGLSFDLVNVQMSKKVATAIFWWFKMINGDTAPCGYGEADDRPDF
ncbi:MAG: hypothetical protein ACKO5C_04670 [Ferruginibacter sp.]